MLGQSISAIAHPNIAFLKYWGNRDDTLRLPVNGSISMNLEALQTRTTLTWEATLEADTLVLNGMPSNGPALERVTTFLDIVRKMAGFDLHAAVTSENNFPMGTGIASSASAFAALALAASRAAGLNLGEKELSRLARRGSGSACRSVPGGFVEWQAGSGDDDSYAYSIAAPNHWQLVDCIAVLSSEHKATGSARGNTLAQTSPLQAARVADAPRRLEICRKAILGRDFPRLAEIVELDSTLMHAVMMTSTPALYYWQAETLALIKLIRAARSNGLAACTTIDAGPNVHILCEKQAVPDVLNLVASVPGVSEIRSSGPGGAVRLVE